MKDVALPFDSHGVSHKGCVRELNEDSYLIEPQVGVWAVADGMGGHEAGEMASSSIVEHLATIGIASSPPDLLARFEDRLSKAHVKIRGIADARRVTIGSTVAALLVVDGKFACLWLGDSRVYLVRSGSILQVSRDHTEVHDLLDRRAITPEEARTWPGRNVITRAVGVGEAALIDFQQGIILAGDVFVLGSVGLTVHVADAEIEAAVSNPPKEACQSLLAKVLERCGTDNVTIVIVRVHGRPVGQSSDAALSSVGSE